MKYLNHVFEILAQVYDTDVSCFTGKKPEAEKYRVSYKLAAYFSYKYILENETGITLSDLSKLLQCSETYILNAYERTVLGVQLHRKQSNETLKVKYYIENGMP